MALTGRRTFFTIASTSAAAPTTILPAQGGTKTRYIRAILPYNGDTVARAWSLEFGAATLTAANSEPFQESIPANSGRSLGPVVYPGRGARIDNVALSAFAGAASVISGSIIFDESDTVDA